jgi:5-methylcytosine-specific restriction endonuclease McrA
LKRSALKPNPEKVREWQARSRKPLRQTPRKQRASLTPAQVREVARQSGGRCIRCGSKRRLQRHHALPVSKWPEHEREPRNMVLACEGCHDEHERAHRRFRHDELPEAVRTWIRSLGGREALYMERTYTR